MSMVRPEFGPTLPELLGPRLRAWSTARWIAIAAAVVAIVAAGAFAVERLRTDLTTTSVRAPVPFRLSYPTGDLVPARARRGEMLRLVTPPGVTPRQRLTVGPLRIPPYRGDVTAALLAMSTGLIEEMKARGYTYRTEGRATVNRQPGYAMTFDRRERRRTFLARRILVVPLAEAQPRPREGIDVLIVSRRGPGARSADVLGGRGALRVALRTLRVGAAA